MTLKCPICGREYSYEGKICQDCEDYSTYSGLTEIESFEEHKWNCALFLEKDNPDHDNRMLGGLYEQW